MEYFSLRVAENAAVTGLRTKVAASAPPKDTPLIVALHGGSYSAQYYDATPTYSAAPYSAFLRVPFIAINRPGYKDSTALPDAIPEESTFLQEEGRYLHNEILPAVWKAYAAHYGVSCIVILAHSLSVPMTIIAAALNATAPSPSSNEQSQNQEQGDEKVIGKKQETKAEQNSPAADRSKEQEETAKEIAKPYPLAGIILSGFGTTPNAPTMARVAPHIDHNAPSITFPTSLKDDLMLYPPSAGFTDPEVYEKTEELNTSAGMAEFGDAFGPWPTYWREKYAKVVKCPVRYTLVENDCFWMSTREAIDDFAGAFESSARVDKGVVLGAVHCLELCRAGRGWYARVFGWAVECGVAFGLRRK